MLRCARSSPSYGLTNDRSSPFWMKKSRISRLFSRNVCAAQQTNSQEPKRPTFSMEVTMNRVILSALLLVALLSGTYLLNGVAVATECPPQRPRRNTVGEGLQHTCIREHPKRQQTVVRMQRHG